MPFLFLSPSTQDFNPYVTTGNEQYWMNRIADEMEPYLRASGVNFTRGQRRTIHPRFQRRAVRLPPRPALQRHARGLCRDGPRRRHLL